MMNKNQDGCMATDGFQRIAIIGLGAVGASLGLALKRTACWARFVGVDTAATLQKAKQIGAIDDGFATWQEGIVGADFVFIDAPMKETEKLIPEIARTLPEGAVLSDSSPVKSKISDMLRTDAKRQFAYIGLHVLRSSGEDGIEDAFPDFFRGVPMLLTPAKQDDMEAFGKVKSIMTTVGAQIFGMTPEAHDQLFAEIRQLPRLATMAYLDLIFSKEATNRHPLETFEPILLNPIRDLSEQTPEWNEEIAVNRDRIVPALRSLATRLESLAEKLTQDQAETEIETGKKRATQVITNRGFRSPVPGIWVSLSAASCSLSSVAEVLARSNIVAKEVETSERDGRRFVEILLENEAEADTAFKRLKGAGFLAGKM
jgi:prephenate dehydrogenase